MNELFSPIATSPSVPASSNLTLLQYDAVGLRVVLEAPAGAKYEVRFPTALAHMVTDEGDRLRSMDWLDGRAATPIGRLEPSKWKQWFVEETLDIRKNDPLVHWCIVTPNDIIEVISQEAPDVTAL